jgi:hypothetical protein
MSDRLLDVIATLLLMFDDRTDEDPLAGDHHVLLSPQGRPSPFDSAEEPAVGSDSDQHEGRLQEAIFDRITSGLLGEVERSVADWAHVRRSELFAKR